MTVVPEAQSDRAPNPAPSRQVRPEPRSSKIGIAVKCRQNLQRCRQSVGVNIEPDARQRREDGSAKTCDGSASGSGNNCGWKHSAIREGAMTQTSWRNRKTLILSRSEMIGLLEPEEYVRCVETAFRRMGEGRVFMEPKGHIVLDKYPGEWEIMPSYIEEPEAAPAAAAVQSGSRSASRNRAKFNLPTVFSILIYTEPETGFPARHCGRHPSHPDADRRVRSGFREMDGAGGLLSSCAGGGRRREHRRLPRLRGDARLEGGSGLEPDPSGRWIRSW